jgi:aspartate aminotransferase
MTTLSPAQINPGTMHTPVTLARNIYDGVTLSKIVEIRDTLIDMQNRGERVYRMESGTPAYPLFPEVAEAIIKAVRDGKTFYTEGAGIRPLRAKICEKLARKNGINHDLSEETVFVGQGAMGVLFCVLTGLLGPSDTIISPSPVWESISNIAKLSSACVVELEIREELGFNWDFDEFASTVERTKPRAVIIVNPGNPTGGIFPKDQVEPLFGLVRRYGFYVIEDLAYEDLVYDPNYVLLTRHAHATGDPEIYSRFIPIFSMSKSQNFSGLRLGYTHLSHPHLIERFRKALLYTTNGVNSISQWGAVEALDSKHDARLRDMAEGYKARGDSLYDGLVKAGVFRFAGKPKGAFYWFPHIDRTKLTARARGRFQVPAADDPTPLGEWMAKYILKSGIGSIAGHYFGPSAHEHIRFAYTCSLDDCRSAGQKLAELFG